MISWCRAKNVDDRRIHEGRNLAETTVLVATPTGEIAG
jgi:hypothetical protein